MNPASQPDKTKQMPFAGFRLVGLQSNTTAESRFFYEMSEAQIAKEIYLSIAELMALKLTHQLRELRNDEMALSLSELVDYVVFIFGNFRNAQHCLDDKKPPMPYSIEQIREWASEYRDVATEMRKAWEEAKI
ncbi:MAG: hypothetical protein IJF84_13730 [Thermoguttaceae bacterium]|nr:hypothetical protein [Thermoguttaceae bacterium]